MCFPDGFRTPGLHSHSVVACEQAQAINTSDLIERIGTLSGTQMLKISLGLAVQFAFDLDE